MYGQFNYDHQTFKNLCTVEFQSWKAKVISASWVVFVWCLKWLLKKVCLFLCIFQVKVAPYLVATALPVPETNLWFFPLCPRDPSMQPHLQRCITNLPGTNCPTKGSFTNCKSQRSKITFHSFYCFLSKVSLKAFGGNFLWICAEVQNFLVLLPFMSILA